MDDNAPPRSAVPIRVRAPVQAAQITTGPEGPVALHRNGKAQRRLAQKRWMRSQASISFSFEVA
ncbi:hypothetical protein HNQ73_001660 [Chelatococcus composti]|jgi:hypothetical protein|uniref:Uncharacterized protein n=1 Tax=Chelatococcus composti TaxID=1743235 RepID=A0A841K6A4_9HYPH|nr:hypothetical protein [Chelatococcus composti]